MNIKGQWDNVDICFDEINEAIFQNAKSVAYIPVSSFYRLVISDILEDERCLFLDGDLIINTDLTEIYDIDLTGKYLAGVKDCGIQRDMGEYHSYKDELEIPTMDGYINAGVLVMNLDLIRKNGMNKAFISCMNHYYKMMDQDILNKCCFGKIKYLDLKYNLFVDYYKRLYLLEKTAFSQREISNADMCNGIIHFTGKYKAWNFFTVRGSHLWWEYAKKALSVDDYDEMHKRAIEVTQKNDWKYIIKRCAESGDIVVAGFSDIGRDAADSLKRCGIDSIRCFCDNNKDKETAQYHDWTVYSMNAAYEKYPKALWINTSQVSAKIISRQLMAMGVKEEDILIYISKSEKYYDNLDDQYKEYEKKLLAFKQSGREDP